MTDKIHGTQCREHHRRRDIRQMVRVVAPDFVEDSFCDWSCFKATREVADVIMTYPIRPPKPDVPSYVTSGATSVTGAASSWTLTPLSEGEMTESSDFPNDDGPLRRARYRLGRWLLQPRTNAIIEHYTRVATAHRRDDDHERESRCRYIMIGAWYVGYDK